MNEKVRYINLYRGLAIILFVLSQVLFVNDIVLSICSSSAYAMLFIAIGAELYETGKEYSIKELLWKLGSPYLFFAVFMLLYQAVSVILERDGFTKDLLVEKVIGIFTLYGEGGLWILPAFVFSIILYTIMQKYLKEYVMVIALIITTIAYFLTGGMTGYVEEATRIPQMIVFRLMMVLWRGVLYTDFIYIGKWTVKLMEAANYKKIYTVPIGIFLLVIGGISGAYNGIVDYSIIETGSPIFFIVSGVCLGAGLLLIAHWIGIFGILEFVGKNCILILVTFADFGILKSSVLTDAFLLARFDNRFIAHTGSFAVIICLELLLILLINNFFPFMIGKEDGKYSVIKMITRQENEDDTDDSIESGN